MGEEPRILEIPRPLCCHHFPSNKAPPTGLVGAAGFHSCSCTLLAVAGSWEEKERPRAKRPCNALARLCQNATATGVKHRENLGAGASGSYLQRMGQGIRGLLSPCSFVLVEQEGWGAWSWVENALEASQSWGRESLSSCKGTLAYQQSCRPLSDPDQGCCCIRGSVDPSLTGTGAAIYRGPHSPFPT